MAVAVLDVGYDANRARAACVVAGSLGAAEPSETRIAHVESVAPYEPGQFYRRELPCLLEVLRAVETPIDLLVVDGYVWLASIDRPGLGAYLYQALGASIPVVGVAKSSYSGAGESAVIAPVLRGASNRPLYVSSVGIDLDTAARAVIGMHGKHRIPDLLRLVDQLAAADSTVKGG